MSAPGKNCLPQLPGQSATYHARVVCRKLPAVAEMRLQRRIGWPPSFGRAALKSAFTQLNLKPTVGFTLPWAGVTPALDDRKRCGLRPVRTFFGSSRPKPRSPGSLPNPRSYSLAPLRVPHPAQLIARIRIPSPVRRERVRVRDICAARLSDAPHIAFGPLLRLAREVSAPPATIHAWR